MNLSELAKLATYEIKVKNKIKIVSNKQMSDAVEKVINTKSPFFIGRLGNTETFCLRTAELKQKDKYSKAIDQLCRWSGFFPNDEKLLQDFANIERAALKQVDLIHPMEYWGENYLIDKYSRKGVCYCGELGCWKWDDEPWTKHLKGKKVLVIHPFTESIKRQYEKREYIFPRCPEMLPDFELVTLKAVQTIAGQEDNRFKDWFSALDWMCNETLKIDYDVALIGCGAYGFALGAFCKRQGKVAIHMGGDVQMQFGIIGSRWEKYDWVKENVNDSWIRPSNEETPGKASIVETSCYW